MIKRIGNIPSHAIEMQQDAGCHWFVVVQYPSRPAIVIREHL